MAGIYLHIPFCKSFCSYCDFYSVTDTEEKQVFVEALLSEAALQSDYLEGEAVATIYFGGGTPSLMSIGETGRIIKRLGDIFKIDQDVEITLEINPDDVRPGYFRELISCGVNRISLGIQTWDNSRLKFLGRRHSAEQSEHALRLAFDEGFVNVSADLIYGIPGVSVEGFRQDLEKMLNYPITHLSAYHLTIEEGTRLGKMRKEGKLEETDEETSSAMFALLGNECREKGFIHYEISNFAREGYISRHNSAYWKQVSYLGLGPSAHSFNTRSRQWNESNLKKYIHSIRKGVVPFEREDLDRITMFNEYVMTSLRTMWGIDLEHVERQYDKELHDYLVNLSDKFLRYGLMRHEKNTLILTEQGKMISDNIIAELLMEL